MWRAVSDSIKAAGALVAAGLWVYLSRRPESEAADVWLAVFSGFLAGMFATTAIQAAANPEGR